jgi:hypothetical protein
MMSRLAAPLLAGAMLLVSTVGCLQTVSVDRARATSDIEATRRVRDFSNPGVAEIGDPTVFDRVVVISDVHGMYVPLLRLLGAGHLVDAQQHWAGGHALFIIVGDSIDKGPQSVEVLDLFAALAAQAPAAGGRVLHLLGNHEAEFLAAGGSGSKAAELLAELQAKNIPVTDLTEPTHPRGAFLAAEPLAARVGRWLFCHAGLYPNMTWAEFKAAAGTTVAKRSYGDPLLSGVDSILEAKDWWKDPAARSSLESRLSANGLYGVVQGHQPKAYGFTNQTGAIDGGRLIKVDNGMAPEAGGSAGTLLVFTRPAELAADGFPHALVVNPDGTSAALQASTL